MPVTFTTGLATQLSERLVTELVERTSGAGMLNSSGGAPAPGPIDGSSTPAVAIGSAAAGAVPSIGPRRKFTFGAVPVWGRSAPFASLTVLFSCMVISPCSVHLDHLQLSGGLGTRSLYKWCESPNFSVPTLLGHPSGQDSATPRPRTGGRRPG